MINNEVVVDGWCDLAGAIANDCIKDLLINVDHEQSIVNKLEANRSSAAQFFMDQENWFNKLGYDAKYIIRKFPSGKDADKQRALRYLEKFGKLPKMGKKTPIKGCIDVLRVVKDDYSKYEKQINDTIAYLNKMQEQLEKIEKLSKKIKIVTRQKSKVARTNQKLQTKNKNLISMINNMEEKFDELICKNECY